MPVNPSNAGPFTIGLSTDIENGERRQIVVSEITKNGKRGYLTKFFGNSDGFDYTFITNESPDPIKVEVSGAGGFSPVPSATSVNFDGPINYVTVKNESGNTISASDITVTVGNGVRSGGNSNPEFSTSKLVSDLIPGF